MSLVLYDENKVAFSSGDSLRTFHNGFLGGPMEKLIYIRNTDSARYYLNVTLRAVFSGYDDSDANSTTGWSIKFIDGQIRPTEAVWDSVKNNEPLNLPDIGSSEAADTHTYYPVWVRVFCPGNTEAKIKENTTLRLNGVVRLVGS